MRSVAVLVLLIGITGAFEVLAPQGHVLAVYGRPAVLGCRYSVDPESPLDRLVLTWQREDNTDVLHSFYYGADQLERQSPRYRNRTGLFASQLLSGNASLRLDPVRPQDVGTYLCFVSNLGGTGKAAVHLSFAGYYTEPRLSIELRSTSATFLYESEGFPEPLVNWKNWEGRNISHFTEVVQRPSEDGLFSLRSQIEVDSAAGVNYTFILQNRILSQVITRNVCLRTDVDRNSTPSRRERWTVLAPLSVALLLYFGCFFIFHWMRKK